MAGLSALVVGATLALTSAGSAQTSGVGLNPPTATFTIPPGLGMSETNKTVTLPQLATSADVEIAIDTTGSMQTGIDDARNEASALVANIQSEVPNGDVDFAVVQFRDIGDSPEYQVMQSMTPTAAKVTSALSKLAAGQGEDPPEAYNLVFHNSYADAANQIGWRSDTRKFVVVIGDAQPHGPVASDGFPACTDETPDPHNLDTKTELTNMSSSTPVQGVPQSAVPGPRTLLMVFENDSGASTSLACYQQLSQFTGGDAVQSNGTGLADEITSLINSTSKTFKDVHLEVDGATPPPADASWITLPPPVTANGPVTSGGTYPFGPIAINVPAGTPPGTYKFDLVALADGNDIGHEVITVIVPQPTNLIICKAPDNGAQGQPFDFTVGAASASKAKKAKLSYAPTAPIEVDGGSCSDSMPVVPGSYTVGEDLSSGQWQVAAVATSPAAALASVNLAAGTAKVNIAGGGTTTVTFTNQKITSTLQVCKWSSATTLQGNTYNFTVTGVTLPAPLSLSVKAGKTANKPICSDPQSVSPGAVLTVKESVPSGQVATITGSGSGTVKDQGNGVAKVSIGAGVNTVVYEDEPTTPPPPKTTTFSVCKSTSGGPLELLPDGTEFNFTVDDGNPNHGGTFQVAVGQCKFVTVNTGNVTVTELGPQPTTQLTQITVDPASAEVAGSQVIHGLTDNDWQNPVAGSVTVNVQSGVATTVTFQNKQAPAPVGSIEICKNVVFPGTTIVNHAYDGTVFTFTVPGVSKPVQVAAGTCSMPLRGVPLDRGGTTQVTETSPFGFALDSVSAFTGVGTCGQQDENCSVSTTDLNQPVATATVTPDPNWLTEVIFNNRPLTAQVKICKSIAPGSEGSLTGKTFSFNVIVGGVPIPGSPVKVKAPGCSGLQVPVNVIANAQGDQPKITVSEVPGAGYSVQSVAVDNIAPGTTASASPAGGTISFAPGPGVDVVTFTNQAK